MTRYALFLCALTLGLPAQAQSIDFGDDSGSYTNDGICDDRRFAGSAMASTLDWEDLARDASDCRAAYSAGDITLWVFSDAVAATHCPSVDFGDDSGEFPMDGECDDPRFEGMAVDGVLLEEDAYRDATDCRHACEYGLLGLRDYRDVKPHGSRKGITR